MSLPEGAAAFLAVQQTEQPSRTYRLNLDGRMGGMIDGIEAVRQFVFKQLQTNRWEYDIYTGRIGHELFGSDAAGAVEEALLVDERILSIEEMKMEQTGDELRLSFTVFSVFGSFESGVSVNV
ncbi:DUF2634 domain-containing protein [Paenibacillus pasadenensis]|uniref:DUF2634 domain-containing protein n=1 Tax=Paenibacillus pasadenensis TaxID=217090 RepID=UPI00203ABA8A|nr:DUF2634 domain-containing protein [Paenibacillus pasadenensis]MCM3748026.1 DUF2634 domain-containing protein [Paenibacillus pasadenensis]